MALACAGALLTAGLLGAPAALAADEAEEDFDVLSSRYGTLDELANSLNEDEAVVVDTRIGVLVAANQALDGALVRFEGEALGEAVQAGGDDVWVAVGNTAGQSISVLMSARDAETIGGVYGSYDATGSTIQVTGTYHVACDEHQGELEVHADAVELVVEGSATEHTVSAKRLRAGVALCVLGVALVMAYELLRRRADRSDGPRARGAQRAQATGDARAARRARGMAGEQGPADGRGAGGRRGAAGEQDAGGTHGQLSIDGARKPGRTRGASGKRDAGDTRGPADKLGADGADGTRKPGRTRDAGSKQDASASQGAAGKQDADDAQGTGSTQRPGRTR